MTIKRLQLSHIRNLQLYLASLYRSEIKTFQLKTWNIFCVVSIFYLTYWFIFD